MRYLSTLFGLIAILQSALATDADTTRRYELTGMLSYSYNKQQEQDPPYSGELPRYQLYHDVSIRPGLGYFLTPEIELQSEFQYVLSFMEYNYFGTIRSSVVELRAKYWSHRFGCRVGANYHFDLSQTAEVFIGTKVGIAWTREGSEDSREIDDSGWKKRELSLPVISCGTKVFVSKDWAFLFQAEYSFTDNYHGNDNLTNSGVSVGLGFAVYL
jgi:hypothetical protein